MVKLEPATSFPPAAPCLDSSQWSILVMLEVVGDVSESIGVNSEELTSTRLILNVSIRLMPSVTTMTRQFFVLCLIWWPFLHWKVTFSIIFCFQNTFVVFNYANYFISTFHAKVSCSTSQERPSTEPFPIMLSGGIRCIPLASYLTCVNNFEILTKY